jgi:uncharacterized protein (DUF362 family)
LSETSSTATINIMNLTRRQFARLSALAGASCFQDIPVFAEENRSAVAIVKTADRKSGIFKAAELLGKPNFSRKDVYLKGAFNSAHPFPATTHLDSLDALVKLLRSRGARNITIVERSGMGQTRKVMEKLNFTDRFREMEVVFLPLDELCMDKWKHIDLSGSHWEHGIDVPDFLNRDSCVVQLCNLKTHRFGGQFSASLKNSVGLIAKYDRKNSRNYMMELHASSFQCQMIAEINQIYSPALIVMDAIQVFIQGGPETGEIASPEIIAASYDRVALDAVGIAILKYSGAGYPFSKKDIFEQEPIKRAVELRLGAKSAEEIELLADDNESRRLAIRLQKLLKA